MEKVIWFCKQGRCGLITQSIPSLHLSILLSFLLRTVEKQIFLSIPTNLLSAHTFVGQNAHLYSHKQGVDAEGPKLLYFFFECP